MLLCSQSPRSSPYVSVCLPKQLDCDDMSKSTRSPHVSTKSADMLDYMRLSTIAEQRIATKRDGAALRTCAGLGAKCVELFGRGDGAGCVRC
jgi:hypothetical protein